MLPLKTPDGPLNSGWPPGSIRRESVETMPNGRDPKDPGTPGKRGGNKHLRSVPPKLPDQVLRVRQLRQLFTTNYLALLNEPGVLDNMRRVLSTASDGKEIGSMLNALLRALVPPEDTLTTAVAITLNTDVPRPPVDVTPRD
jgi:hypothetical protein